MLLSPLGLMNAATQVPQAAAPTTVWNSSSGTPPSATDWVLSNGNLTATNSNATSADRLLRANKQITTTSIGYFEATMTLSSGHISFGFTTAAAPTNDWVEDHGLSWDSANGISLINVVQSTVTFLSGNVIGFGIKNMGGGVYKVFPSKNGAWLTSVGDPTTNTGGIDISSLVTGGVYIAGDSTGLGSIVLNTTGGFSQDLTGSGLAAFG